MKGLYISIILLANVYRKNSAVEMFVIENADFFFI